MALSRAGWSVTAIDIVEELRSTVGPVLEAGGGRFLTGDAMLFAADEPVDLLWDHTFFCAIPPPRRVEFGMWVRGLLAPGGRIYSLVFPFDKPPDLGGPPFSMTAEDLAASLGDSFALLEDSSVQRCGAGRAWQERWAAFELTP